jgi:hypothetical protein
VLVLLRLLPAAALLTRDGSGGCQGQDGQQERAVHHLDQ